MNGIDTAAPRAPGSGGAREGAPRVRRGRLAAWAGAALAAVLLAATFALYLRPGLMLDVGQLLALCGFR